MDDSSSRNIRKHRIKKGLSQLDLSRQLGVKHNTISNWERGKCYPDIPMIHRLCDILDTNPSELLGYKSPEQVFTAKEIVKEADPRGILRRYYGLTEPSMDYVDSVIDHEFNSKTATLLPVYETIERPILYSRIGRDIVEVPDDTFEYRTSVDLNNVPEETNYIVHISGDSMAPTFMPGDRLFVKKTEDLNEGDIGVFSTSEGMIVKEYRKDLLVSHNKAYRRMSPDELEDLKVEGIVIGKVS